MKLNGTDIDLGLLKVQIASLDPTKHHIVHVRVGSPDFMPSPKDLEHVAATIQDACDAAHLNVSVFATAPAVEIDIVEVWTHAVP